MRILSLPLPVAVVVAVCYKRLRTLTTVREKIYTMDKADSTPKSFVTHTVAVLTMYVKPFTPTPIDLKQI